MNLETINPGAKVKGIVTSDVVPIVGVRWIGTGAVEVVYRDHLGIADRLLYRTDEPHALLRLASEAQRIRLAHLFVPHLAVQRRFAAPRQRCRARHL